MSYLPNNSLGQWETLIPVATTIFGKIFGGGGPSRQTKISSSMQGGQNILSTIKTPEDTIRFLEDILSCIESLEPLDQGFNIMCIKGIGGRARWVAACEVARKLGWSGRACSPYDIDFISAFKSLKKFIIGVLPRLKKEATLPAPKPVIQPIPTIMKPITAVPSPLPSPKQIFMIQPAPAIKPPVIQEAGLGGGPMLWVALAIGAGFLIMQTGTPKRKRRK